MNHQILTIADIENIVRPLVEKYHISEVYLFGSYARGEAESDSDLDFFVIGGDQFKRTRIFAFAEDLREAFDKDVDVFEIHEINQDSAFYQNILRDRRKVA
jgi:predicted nucleotidyltransferase